MATLDVFTLLPSLRSLLLLPFLERERTGEEGRPQAPEEGARGRC